MRATQGLFGTLGPQLAYCVGIICWHPKVNSWTLSDFHVSAGILCWHNGLAKGQLREQVLKESQVSRGATGPKEAKGAQGILREPKAHPNHLDHDTPKMIASGSHGDFWPCTPRSLPFFLGWVQNPLAQDIPRRIPGGAKRPFGLLGGQHEQKQPRNEHFGALL